MAQASPKPVEGIQWPVTDKSSGERGSTKTSQQIWAKSFAAMDSSVSEQVEREKNWRYKYARFVKQHVQLSLQTPENALNAAKAGLDEFHNKFEFIRDGQVYTLGEAMSKFDRKIFETGVIKGKKERPAQGYQYGVPYKGGVLQGDALLAQLKKWAERGTIEPDTAEAIGKVASSSVNLDLSDLYFVLLGAGSAMGPYSILMSLGANVIALDIDRPMAWKRLISIAEESPGTLIFPTKKSIEGLTRDQIFEVAGCNLMTQTPEITRWLRDLYPEKDLIIGTYVYLDGEAHVRVALACDAIVKSLCERSKKPSLVYLCTPTDVHVIPQAASQAASKNYSDTGLKNLALLPIKVIPGHGKLVRNVQPKIVAKDGTEFYIVDGIVVAQGPNYALAKRMQHWRAIVARSQGCVVSSHIAPSTSTASVTSNRSFAWAYDGMPYFRPYEIPVQDTSNAVMAALLIHDVRNKAAPANPSYPLKNPLELFKFNSFHGGLWRSGYTINTIGEVSVLIHFIKVGKPVIFVFAILAVAALLRFFGRI